MSKFVSRWKQCPTCKGTGKITPEPENGDEEEPEQITCPTCRGRKRILGDSMM